MNHTLALLTVLLFAPLAMLHAAEARPKRPLNLLFIITDQQRWDAMSCAGNTVLKTPNLDKLAAQGMVTEVDDWIGRIMDRLADLGLADNTLIVFTSDHGEMLGDHGLHGKFVFYEGSVHVPLLMRLPGVIPPDTVVKAPASHIDLFPTFLDYRGKTEHESEGRSLRPLIEGRENGEARIAVSEWPSTRVPGFMICDGRWKLLYGRAANAPSLDAPCDLQSDPHELNNLIGSNPDKEKHRADAGRMKGLLMEWLARVKSPHLEGVRERPLLVESRLPKSARNQ